MSEAPTGVVVVAFGNEERLRRCIAAIREDDPGVEIWVVDNDPASAISADWMAGQGGVVYLRQARNRGFAAGANIGLREAFAAGTAQVLLINDDVYIEPGCLSALADAVGVRGAASPWLAGEGDAAYRGGMIDWRRGFAGHQEGANDYLLGGCMMISRGAWESVGPFDEEYFLYCEDVDWSLRARAAGVPLQIVPIELAFHDGGASTGGAQGKTWAYWWARNRVRLVRRHRGGHGVSVAGRQVLRAGKDLALRTGPPSVALARAKGAIAGLRA